MNYDQAKTNFENIVLRMQEELKEYANKPRASQKAIEIRLANINQLVEFYTIAMELISEEQMKNMELELGLMKHYSSTQRLIYWCQLHRANPDAMFFYSDQELKDQFNAGVRFGRVEDLYWTEDPEVTKAQDKYVFASLHAKKTNFTARSEGGFSDEQIAMMYSTCLYNFKNHPQPYAQ